VPDVLSEGYLKERVVVAQEAQCARMVHRGVGGLVERLASLEDELIAIKCVRLVPDGLHQ
jgi:hypothetical protein